jgi:hypothetical protein
MILPVLHKNRIQLFGMKKTPCYLALKRIDDLFIALDKDHTLITWKITTGKTKFIKQLKKNYGLNEYEVYEEFKSNYHESEVDGRTYFGHTEWNQNNVLLRSKLPTRT